MFEKYFKPTLPKSEFMGYMTNFPDLDNVYKDIDSE